MQNGSKKRTLNALNVHTRRAKVPSAGLAMPTRDSSSKNGLLQRVLNCVLQDLGASTNVLYAFVEGENVLYIGKSVRSLKQRLYGYQNPGPTQFTNIKANKLIREALGTQRSIAVYAFADPGDLRHGGFHVNLAAGLEDSLIATLKPAWNKAGL